MAVALGHGGDPRRVLVGHPGHAARAVARVLLDEPRRPRAVRLLGRASALPDAGHRYRRSGRRRDRDLSRQRLRHGHRGQHDDPGGVRHHGEPHHPGVLRPVPLSLPCDGSTAPACRQQLRRACGGPSAWRIGAVRIASVRSKRLSNAAKRRHVALFEREFHTLSQLAHPRVVSVFDYGVDEGTPYYTMELLDGGIITRDVAFAAATHPEAIRTRTRSSRGPRQGKETAGDAAGDTPDGARKGAGAGAT